MRKKIYISGIAFLILLFGIQLARPYSGYSSNNPLAADFFSIFEDPFAKRDLCGEEEILAIEDSTASLRSDPFSFHAASPVVQVSLDRLGLYLLHHSYLI